LGSGIQQEAPSTEILIAVDENIGDENISDENIGTIGNPEGLIEAIVPPCPCYQTSAEEGTCANSRR
jgi:hypothetical protein